MTRFEKLAAFAAALCYGGTALHFAFVGGGSPDLNSPYRRVLALGAVMMLATIQPLTSRVTANARGFLAWGRNLAFLSQGLLVVEGLADPQLVPMRGRSELTPFDLDPYMWVILGGLGLWLVAVNAAALRGSMWPRGLSIIGCIAGACCALFPLAVFGAINRYWDYVVELPLAIGIGLLAPAWFIWVAIASPGAES